MDTQLKSVEMSRRRILYIANTDPRLTNSGTEQRTHLLWRALCRLGTVVTLVSSDVASGAEEALIYRTRPLPVTGWKRKVNVLWYHLLGSKWVMRQLFFPQRITEVEAYGPFDCIVVRYAYGLGIHHYWRDAPGFVDVDDHPLEAFDTRDGGDLHWRIRWAARMSLRLRLPYLFGKLQGAWIANATQVKDVRTKGLTRYLPNLPMPVSRSYRPDGQRRQMLMTVGLMAYGPNYKGVDRFLAEIWPEIRKRFPALEYWVVGRGAPEPYMCRWQRLQGVKVLGFVEALDAIYEQALAIVVPIDAGGGTCIKTLESLSRSRICLSTPFGARGWSDDWPTEEIGLCIYESATDFVRLLEQNVLNAEVRRQIERRAGIFAQDHFSFEAFCDSVKSVIDAGLCYDRN